MAKKKKEKKQLPEPLETQHTYVNCGPIVNTHTQTQTSASQYMPLGVDNSWDFDEWTGGFEIKIQSLTPDRLEFDMISVDPAVANALRRILISEVPTVAIEHVFIVNNTSIIQDEVLSHRLGLIPLAVDPSLVAWRGPEDAANESNTVVFKIDVHCSRAEDGSMINDKVLSSELKWLPNGSELPDETNCRFQGSQLGTLFSSDNAPRDVEQNILVAKMRPGQSIELEAHAVKGIGREHAKWSPVATAWYRLQPEVVLMHDVTGADAAELAAAVPGLFSVDNKGKLVVGEARQHEDKLEKVRRLLENDKWAEAIQLRKRKDHFIFTVESTGCVPAEELFRQALAILEAKCMKTIDRLNM